MQQQAPSPPHLACPLLAVPFLVPWRANHPTTAKMAAPCAHPLATPTLRAHSYRTGSPGRAMQLSPRVHSPEARKPHVGFRSKQKHLLQPCPSWGELWAGGGPWVSQASGHGQRGSLTSWPSLP